MVVGRWGVEGMVAMIVASCMVKLNLLASRFEA